MLAQEVASMLVYDEWDTLPYLFTSHISIYLPPISHIHLPLWLLSAEDFDPYDEKDTLSYLQYSSRIPLSQCSLSAEDFDPHDHPNTDFISMHLNLLILFATIVSQPIPVA